MAINTNGLLTTGGPATYVSDGPPSALINEIRGGIHRISGRLPDLAEDFPGDQLNNIDARYLQVGMLVYDESATTYYMYKNAGDPPADPIDSNDPYRDNLGNMPNNVGVIGDADSNWVEFRLGIDHTTLESLSNVSLADGVTPAPGQVLEIATVDNTDPDNPVVTWQNAADNPLNNSIEQLSDVEADGRTTGQVLRYNEVTADWENAHLALTDLMNIADDIAMAEDGDGFGFRDGEWHRRPNATPSYPVDQLIVEDQNAPGQFVPANFLYELMVSIDTTGTRRVDWMETPGQVSFDLEARPDIDESETAFRRAPSDYAIIGYGDSLVDANPPVPEEQRDTVEPNLTIQFAPNLNGLGPIVWGQPNPDETAIVNLVGTQPALYFFGTNPGDGTAFPRQALASDPLDGDSRSG